MASYTRKRDLKRNTVHWRCSKCNKPTCCKYNMQEKDRIYIPKPVNRPHLHSCTPNKC